jgi:hypothetical protein
MGRRPLAVPRAIHDFQVVFEGAETVIVIVPQQLEIVARRAAADAQNQAVVRHRLERLHPVGELDRLAQRELQAAANAARSVTRSPKHRNRSIRATAPLASA